MSTKSLPPTFEKAWNKSDWATCDRIATEAIKDDQDNSHAYYLSGLTKSRMGDFTDALAMALQAVDINPEYAHYHELAMGCFGELGRMKEAIGCAKQAFLINPTQAIHRNLVVSHFDYEGASQAEMLAQMTAYCERWMGPELTLPPRDLSLDRKLKIGYVSGDFHGHSAQYLVAPVIVWHDKDQFDITLYASQQSEDGYTSVYQRIPNVRWFDASKLTDRQLAEQIRDDGIDVLIDLGGFSGSGRLQVFGHKPAPIQVHAIGYLCGTGMKQMDYLLSDSVLTPNGDHSMTIEEPWIMSSCLPFAPPPNMPPVSELPEIKNGYRQYSFLQRSSKISPGVIDEWAEILNDQPNSRLILKSPSYADPGVAISIESQLWYAGIDGGRIEVVREGETRYRHMMRYQDIDLALDSYPIGGGTSTLESCFMGVPVVTKPREWIQSRIGTSIMTTLGYPNGIDPHCSTEELAKIRYGLRERLLQSSICQPRKYARELEDGYREMYRRWVDRQSTANGMSLSLAS